MVSKLGLTVDMAYILIFYSVWLNVDFTGVVSTDTHTHFHDLDLTLILKTFERLVPFGVFFNV